MNTKQVYAKIGGVPTIDGIPVYPIFGATAPVGRHGILSSGDVIGPRNLLLSSLGDGFDLTTLWSEFQDLLDEWNTHRTSLASLLRFPVTEPGSAVPQGISGVQMELATEYGVPQSVGPPVEAVVLGYKRDDYDTRNAFSWRYLRSASVENVRAVMNSILEADNRLVNGLTMHRLFNPAPEHTGEGFTAYGLWSNDGMTPPSPFPGVEFSSTATHYLTSEAAVIDSADVESLVGLVRGMGYGLAGSGQTLLLLCHPAESEAVQTWRDGQPSRSGGRTATHDFVASAKAPPHYSPDVLVEQPVPGDLYGVEILGTYGYVSLAETPYCPQGYIAVVATGGPNSPSNCVGFREDPDPSQRGLRIIPGSDFSPYPIQGAFMVRSCGVGVRQRGGAAIMQISTNASYTPPPRSAFGL